MTVISIQLLLFQALSGSSNKSVLIKVFLENGQWALMSNILAANNFMGDFAKYFLGNEVFFHSPGLNAHPCMLPLQTTKPEK